MAPGPDGTADSAYEFAGTVNSYIEFPNTEGGPLDVRYSRTMLCWVYHYGQNGPLFNYKTSGQCGVHLWVVAGQLFVRFTHRKYGSTNALHSTHLDGGWKFVGASYDGGSGDAKLWVNGPVVQTLNIGKGIDLATQDNIRMGVKTGDWRYFKGRIAQMQVFNSALSQEEIQAIYKRMQGTCFGCSTFNQKPFYFGTVFSLSVEREFLTKGLLETDPKLRSRYIFLFTLLFFLLVRALNCTVSAIRET